MWALLKSDNEMDYMEIIDTPISLKILEIFDNLVILE